MSDDLDIFDDDGLLPEPTVRGNTNLDAQDYTRGQTGPSDTGSDILDDELQEDSPLDSQSGAGPATDIEGTATFEMEPEPEGPGMDQTTFGAHPWGPGGKGGYRPHSMQETDMQLSGDEPKGKPIPTDDMMREPEALVAADMAALIRKPKWHGNRNEQPSNAQLVEDTIYDRDSYEINDSSQATIGSGIFEMEEGVTWRPRDGIFAEQYALPAYIADEDEMGVQQSEMWDTTAGNWRVVQPSASGVPLSARVPRLKRAYSPFVAQPPEMRQESTGPRSHIEAFGRKAAKLIVAEAKMHAPRDRSAFLVNATNALSPGTAARCHAVAQKLIEYGYPPEAAFEDTFAHCVMHAVMDGLARDKAFVGLNRLVARAERSRAALQAAAAQHLTPLTRDRKALSRDVATLMSSPAKAGMGAVGADPAPAAADAVAPKSIFSMKNMLIAGAAIGGGYLLWSNRKKIVRNMKKLVRR